jgi:hypothetical protein
MFKLCPCQLLSECISNNSYNTLITLVVYVHVEDSASNWYVYGHVIDVCGSTLGEKCIFRFFHGLNCIKSDIALDILLVGMHIVRGV